MISEPFTPPPVKELLKEGYLAINEAVYVLTGWPKFGLFHSTISPLPEEIKAIRSFFFLPGPKEKFNPQALKVNNIFKEMKLSILNGELDAKFIHLCEGVSFLIRPWDVVVWALLKGYSFPMDLQDALEMYQAPDKKFSKSNQLKIQAKIAAQVLLEMDPTLTVTNIINQPFMHFFRNNRNCKDKERKAVRRAANEVFSEKGKRGRPPKDPNKRTTRKYFLKPIPGVMMIHSSGKRLYHFQTLRIAMQAAAKVIIHQVKNEKLNRMTLSEFWDKFTNHKVVKLYLEEASEAVLAFVHKFVIQVLRIYLNDQAHHSLADHVRKHGSLPIFGENKSLKGTGQIDS